MSGHKFDSRRAASLEGFWRRRLAPWREVLDAAAPGPDEDWADIGCGPGFYAEPLARRARTVHALDLSPDMVALVAAKAARLGLDNVRPAVCGEAALSLPDAAVHGVLLVFVVHELDRPEAFFAETARVLRPGGRIMVVEFAAEGFSLGPPRGHRVTAAQVRAWAAAAGLAPGAEHRWSRRLLGWRFLDFAGLVLHKP
ncbi:MAG: class I SAM-dependent methyltransferase [Thermodesulfobacteriota bacterium]